MGAWVKVTCSIPSSSVVKELLLKILDFVLSVVVWLIRPPNARKSSLATIPSMAVKTVAYPAMRRSKKATRIQLVNSMIAKHVRTVLPRIVLASGESSDDSDSSYEGDSSEQSDEGETTSSEGRSSEDTDEEEETVPVRIQVRGGTLEPPSPKRRHKRACLPQPCPDAASEPCRIVRVNADVGLKRGKCHYCQQKQL